LILTKLRKAVVQQESASEKEGEPAGPTAEAARWLAGLELGTADLDAFEQWRGSDPYHALAFARVYASAETLSALAQSDEPAETPRVATLPRRHFLRNAAAGAVLAAGGSVFFASRALAWSHASTTVGEFRKVSLPDGSIVALNTDTAISWRFETERRRIRLDRGEIALDLGPGTPASFSAAGTEASLSAGHFVARLRPRTVDLLVLRGRALVTNRDKGNILVSALEEASLSSAASLLKPASDERISRITAWQNGEIEFDDERLADAVEEYNRYLSRKIVIDDPRLADLRIGGRFASADPESFFHALALGLDVRVVESGQGVHIQSKK
jgi:transmembrane sensor